VDLMEYKIRNLDELLSKTEYILRECNARFKKPCILWSTGKDSTALLHMAKTTFFGKIPWDVVHMDTTYKFPEIYKFRDKLAKEWNIPLKIANKITEHKPGDLTEDEVFNCCMDRKTLALKEIFEKEHYDAAILAIRWSELGVRSKEHFFSPRTHKWEWIIVKPRTEDMEEGDSPFVAVTEPELWSLYQTDFGKDCEHVRVHPILHWSEIEIWEYIKRNNIPYNPLYNANYNWRKKVLSKGKVCRSCKCYCYDSDYPSDCLNDESGKNFIDANYVCKYHEYDFPCRFPEQMERYRSLGCYPCTRPIQSSASTIEEFQDEIYTSKTPERAGRKQKDKIMERLRYLGYM